MAAPVTLTRPWPEDADTIVAALSDWQVTQWLSVVPWPYAMTDAQAFIAEAGPDEHAVRQGDRLVGMIRAGQSFGIWIAPGAQGQGIGLRAAVLALSRRFNEGAEMVESYHLAGNRRSAGLLARLGFRPVGQEMRWSRPHGREMAAVKLRLARDDFAARHGIALATARLLIDAPRPADLPALHQIVTTPQIARMLLLFHPGMSVEDIAPIFGDQSLTLPMRLVARSGGRVVGSVGIGAGEKPRIYYFLAPDQVGQGLGQEMVGAFLDEIRARFDPAELLADVFLDNQPSRLLLKNLGFQRGEDGPLASLGRDSVDEGTVYNWRRRPAS
ncbi:MAG: GNAT family N-acetyltransferase [Paracoccus sp. (in: a-proteobacteria)]|uniref:GNAT family N-acetyltransferase n=4 Tax=Paracoccus TaxID=265 RepID=UPI000C5C77E6|nr:GNAT family N-acetyltransferase [Paracoccus sp. UBA889]MAN57518.1 hypothetical protein [Paracoccus sp. (in: a-proteobacteria)]MDB2551387.1 GNAT family N-acetyltransferase [Paracoccus sp. (in: a-proteobacteria)]HIC64451.1 N-acetyltransferase [Paracoccus sp. (in: a-proteobacteria)]|tara:strand:+ start:3463 stop:4446 length:984 start_codon:yes stop_codon:yes gene_type:complete